MPVSGNPVVAWSNFTVPLPASEDLHDAVEWHALHDTASLKPPWSRRQFGGGSAMALGTPAGDRRSCGLAWQNLHSVEGPRQRTTAASPPTFALGWQSAQGVFWW